MIQDSLNTPTYDSQQQRTMLTTVNNETWNHHMNKNKEANMDLTI